jgi:(E)-4-hydroxy-3-methylbut-2-enyl-diphosphate synthase
VEERIRRRREHDARRHGLRRQRPGESKAASIGISLPGTGEEPHCPVYIDGQHFTTLKGPYEELAVAFRALIDDYIATKYPRREHARAVTA